MYFIQSSNCLLCHRYWICVLLRKCPKNVVTCGFVTVSVTATAMVCNIQGPFRFAGHIRMGQDERADADGQRRRRRLGLQDRRALSARATQPLLSGWSVFSLAPSSALRAADGPKAKQMPLAGTVKGGRTETAKRMRACGTLPLSLPFPISTP